MLGNLGLDELDLGVGVLLRLAVQEDHDVSILLDTVVRNDPLGQEVVCPEHRRVEHRLLAEWNDPADLVPEQVAGGKIAEIRVVEHLCDASESLTARSMPVEGAPGVRRSNGRL